MKIVTVEQMRQLEQRADAAGVSYAQMMEAAGRAVADEIARRWDVRAKKVLVLVGPGNNGGDGLVAARHLHDAGARVTVYAWKQTKGSEVANSQASTSQSQREFERSVNAVRAEADSDFTQLRAELAASEIVVDALLGTGANRPIEGALKAILDAVKSLSPKIVAVDLPSGMNADTGTLDPATVSADLTVTFAYPKVGFYHFPAADALGELVVADIGIPPAFAAEIAVELATHESVRPLLPARPRDGHKGTFGKAMIAAGSPSYTGAPYLSAAAAARVGAGLVTLATTPEVQRIVAASLHEATYLLLQDDALQSMQSALDAYDALLIGPGLGRSADAQQLVLRTLTPGAQLPALVVDADALNILSEQDQWWRRLPAHSVLTPHVGEFARLAKLSVEEIARARIEVARTHARQWNQIVLLKGAFTLIAEPEGRVTVLPFANPALATAGSGDVLAGISVGLLAQGLTTREAAIVGGYVHGVAGLLAAAEIGDAGALASDLLPRIPRALRQIKTAHG